ncbi:MAG: hypothetical protein LAT68_02540 [Cyclobacteriaceae bacterium]|nr:hypothetical protein [Cyclobacteriaceae bacterium]MCH8515182.1 hypothetical protein [Cyclobacteriaceae bacterium]
MRIIILFFLFFIGMSLCHELLAQEQLRLMKRGKTKEVFRVGDYITFKSFEDPVYKKLLLTDIADEILVFEKGVYVRLDDVEFIRKQRISGEGLGGQLIGFLPVIGLGYIALFALEDTGQTYDWFIGGGLIAIYFIFRMLKYKRYHLNKKKYNLEVIKVSYD